LQDCDFRFIYKVHVAMLCGSIHSEPHTSYDVEFELSVLKTSPKEKHIAQSYFCSTHDPSLLPQNPTPYVFMFNFTPAM
jgi:hypothetical protein